MTDCCTYLAQKHKAVAVEKRIEWFESQAIAAQVKELTVSNELKPAPIQLYRLTWRNPERFFNAKMARLGNL